MVRIVVKPPPQGALRDNDIYQFVSQSPEKCVLVGHWSALTAALLGQLDHDQGCPLDSKGNYSATSNNTKLVHWPLMGGLLPSVQRGGAWAGSPPRPLLAVPIVIAHPSTASVPITVLLYDGRLLCGFNVAIKVLTRGQSNLTKSASRGAHSQGVESCTIEFLG